jgi:hypothetical protein
MSQAEARSWWADVQHLREAAERRQEAEGRAARATRFDRSHADPDQSDDHERGQAAASERQLAEVAQLRRLPARRVAARRVSGPPPRRTVEITGHPAGVARRPRLVEIDRRRPARHPAARVAHRPDRIALWAVLLGIFLCLVALGTSSHAATPPAHPAPVVAHVG